MYLLLFIMLHKSLIIVEHINARNVAHKQGLFKNINV